MLISNQALGNILKQFRLKSKKSQTDVSYITGISNSHLSQVEAGNRGFGEKNLMKLLRLYGINKNEFTKLVIAEDNRLQTQKKTPLFRFQNMNCN